MRQSACRGRDGNSGLYHPSKVISQVVSRHAWRAFLRNVCCLSTARQLRTATCAARMTRLQWSFITDGVVSSEVDAATRGKSAEVGRRYLNMYLSRYLLAGFRSAQARPYGNG